MRIDYEIYVESVRKVKKKVLIQSGCNFQAITFLVYRTYIRYTLPLEGFLAADPPNKGAHFSFIHT